MQRLNYQKIIADYNLSEQIELFSNSNEFKFIHYAGPTKPIKDNLGKYHIEPYVNYILEFMKYTSKLVDDKGLFELADRKGEYLNSFERLGKRAKSLMRRLSPATRNKK